MGGRADSALWRFNEVGGVFWLEDACARNILRQLMQRKEQPILARPRMVCGLPGGLIVGLCFRQESCVPWNPSERLWPTQSLRLSPSLPHTLSSQARASLQTHTQPAKSGMHGGQLN